MTIDWTKPIEKLVNGNWVAVTKVGDENSCVGELVEWGKEKGRWFIERVADGYFYYEDGKAYADGPKLRNRAEPVNDELAELRAFKEAAIARFPELGVVIDSDFAEAKQLMQETDWSSGTECSSPNDPDFEGSVCDVVLKGIKRGRELERYAQGLTTPKD